MKKNIKAFKMFLTKGTPEQKARVEAKIGNTQYHATLHDAGWHHTATTEYGMHYRHPQIPGGVTVFGSKWTHIISQGNKSGAGENHDSLHHYLQYQHHRQANTKLGPKELRQLAQRNVQGIEKVLASGTKSEEALLTAHGSEHATAEHRAEIEKRLRLGTSKRKVSDSDREQLHYETEGLHREHQLNVQWDSIRTHHRALSSNGDHVMETIYHTGSDQHGNQWQYGHERHADTHFKVNGSPPIEHSVLVGMAGQTHYLNSDGTHATNCGACKREAWVAKHVKRGGGDSK